MQNHALVIWIGEGEEISSDPGFSLDVHQYVFYPGEIVPEDCFPFNRYEKEVQDGSSVYERLFNAVRRMFDYRFEKVVFINGSGAQLNGAMIRTAFEKLNEYDVVILPSGPGNIKLFALKKPLLRLFKPAVWQSDEMVLDLILLMQEKGMSYWILS